MYESPRISNELTLNIDKKESATIRRNVSLSLDEILENVMEEAVRLIPIAEKSELSWSCVTLLAPIWFSKKKILLRTVYQKRSVASQGRHYEALTVRFKVDFIPRKQVLEKAENQTKTQTYPQR
jgi:hypothetical protein